MPIIAGRASAAYGAGFGKVLSSGVTPWSPEGAFEALATVTVGSTAVSSISFTGIPPEYKHLQVRSFGRTSRTDYVLEDANITINNDTGANYSWHRFYSNPTVGNTAMVSNSSANANYMNSATLFGTAALSNIFGVSITDILDYSSTTKYKTVRSLTGMDTNGQNLFSVEGFTELSSGSWRSIQPITSLTWTPTTGTQFLQYTTFALYGVR